MFKPGEYRDKARNYSDLAKTAPTTGEEDEYHRLERTFTQLADNEQWLSDNHSKTIRSTDHVPYASTALSGVDAAGLAREEEHILRCLGAALIMQWNTVPTKLRRELFDSAGSMGDLIETTELRAQIARFLHKHKDDETHAIPHGGGSQD